MSLTISSQLHLFWLAYSTIIFFQRKVFVIFRKPNFLIFRTRYIQNSDITRRIFRALVYLEPKAYSENCQTSTMERFAKNSYLAYFLTPSSKNEKSYIFLHFGKWNFLALMLRYFLYFPKRELLLYIGKWNPPPKNIPYISGNGSP